MKHLILIAVAATVLVAADATGTWTGTLTRSEGQTSPARIVLKQDGDKLTGTAGPDENEQGPIQNGKVENDELTFEVSRDNAVMRFHLKQDGDGMTGTVTRERDGQIQKATVALKRDK